MSLILQIKSIRTMAEAVTQPKGILKEPSIAGSKPSFDPTKHQPPRIN